MCPEHGIALRTTAFVFLVVARVWVSVGGWVIVADVTNGGRMTFHWVGHISTVVKPPNHSIVERFRFGVFSPFFTSCARRPVIL